MSQRSQSKNPFAPNYVDPWWFKVSDLIPTWLALVLLVLEGGFLMAVALASIIALLTCKPA